MHKLRLTTAHHSQLMKHLHPGDEREAIAFVLCGHRAGADSTTLVSHEVHPVPYEKCKLRRPDALEWSTEASYAVLEEARRGGLSVLKIHSHPSGYRRFSMSDDESDSEFFPAAYSWMDQPYPHASAILLPSGEIVARVIGVNAEFMPVGLVAVVGDNIRFWTQNAERDNGEEYGVRTDQAFGQGTTKLMRSLKAGVVGCSGTGSLVIEQLVRLGVGSLVLVDPESVGTENLNRIIQATAASARLSQPKVDIVQERIDAIGLGTNVVPRQTPVQEPETVRALAECDVVFGCMDRSFGRYVLNRLATYYLIPYIDVGVGLSADGHGGINHIAGVVHYLKPSGSSLISRGAITQKQIAAEALHEADPKAYEEQLARGYVEGVNETRPAVISVNMHYASLAVLEFLSRLHGVRVESNAGFASYRYTYTHDFREKFPDGEPCPDLAPKTGLGDRVPLLDMPSLS